MGARLTPAPIEHNLAVCKKLRDRIAFWLRVCTFHVCHSWHTIELAREVGAVINNEINSPRKSTLKRLRRVALFGLIGFLTGPLAVVFIPFALASGFESLPVPNQSVLAVIFAMFLTVIIAVVCYFPFAYIHTIILIGAILGGLAGVGMACIRSQSRS